MPKLVTIHANPDFENKKDADYQAIKKAGPKVVWYQTALENIRLSEGRFQIQPEQTKKAARINTDLADMSLDDLKVMMLSLGSKTEKIMKKADVIALIRTKLAGVEIVDDEPEE